jgi:hypothetical protein
MGLLFLVSLAIGGMKGFVPVLLELVSLLVGVGFVVLVVWALIRKSRSQGSDQLSDSVLNSGMQNRPMPAAEKVEAPQRKWTEAEIIECLRKIDWYQFEKLNAAILGKEGWVVERKGGANPDGGVDLVAVKDGVRMLVQCKHWRSWKIQLKVVNEMLGSMTHFGVTAGAIHTLTGWTGPAAEYAAEHRISLCNEIDLAGRARANLSDDELAQWLLDKTHHCPKCEAPMVWRTGNFPSFWGCSTFPRCRGVIKSEG